MNVRLRSLVSCCVLTGAIVILARSSAPVAAQPKATPIVIAPQAPTLAVPFPIGAQRGQTIELTLTGTNLNDPVALWTSFPSKATIPTDANNGKDAAKVRVKLEVPADAPIGFHMIRLATKQGISNARLFCIDELPQVDEVADNKSKEKAQTVPMPCVVIGKTEAESSDFFKVTTKPGQRLSFEVLGRRLGSQLDPIVRVYDAKTGRDLPGHYSDDEPGLQSDARLTQLFPSGGEFLVEVRDTRHLGGADYYYRLRIAECPGAMTAYPVAVKRGAKASIQFTGKHAVGANPVEITMPTDAVALQVSPKSATGQSGWPVQVAASDIDELVEQEPNNDLAKPQKLAIPSGVTARFLEKGDVDCFGITVKKGIKYAIVAETYAILSPAEVNLVIKDTKGTVIAKNNEAQTPARIDFTAPADGDYVIVAEHQNYLHGPTEVYHLSIREAGPDFDVQVQLDRAIVAPGEATVIPVAPATRREFTGPIEVVVVGPPGFSGSVTVPNAPPPPPNQPAPPAALLVVRSSADAKVGAAELKIVAKATINGKEAVKPVTASDAIRGSLNGLPFPPRDVLSPLSVGVTDKPAFTVTVKLSTADVIRGVAANVTVTAKRADGFADEIQLAPLPVPANVTVAVKPIPKGANEVTFPLTAAANAAIGPFPLTFRVTGKPGGKDVAYYSLPTVVNVAGPVDVKVEPSPLTLKAGQKAKLKVTIARKGDYKGPVDVEVKNLPANVTAPKATIAATATSVEVELSATAAAMPVDKPDVQVTATATAAANQVTTSPNIVLKIVK